jgi:hypothetical protein
MEYFKNTKIDDTSEEAWKAWREERHSFLSHVVTRMKRAREVAKTIKRNEKTMNPDPAVQSTDVVRKKTKKGKRKGFGGGPREKNGRKMRHRKLFRKT